MNVHNYVQYLTNIILVFFNVHANKYNTVSHVSVINVRSKQGNHL